MRLPGKSDIKVDKRDGDDDVYLVKAGSQWARHLHEPWTGDLRLALAEHWPKARVEPLVPIEHDARGEWYTFIIVDVTGARMRIDDRGIRRFVLDWCRNSGTAPRGLAAAPAMG